MIDVTRHPVNDTFLTVTTHSPEQEIHPPALLLPGTGVAAADWDVVAADLSRDRMVYALDLQGHGQSEWSGTYSIDLMAQDLVELLRQLTGGLDLIGHSLGGLVACRALAFGAGEVRRLVLEDVGLIHPREPSMPTRPRGNLDFDWAVVEQVRPEIDTPASHWPDTLARIAVPTLVIGGGTASHVPQEHVRQLVDLVRRGHLVTIDAGHSIHTADPAAFIRATRQFLDS